MSDLRQVDGFLWIPQFPPPIKQCHDIAEIMLKVILNTIPLIQNHCIPTHQTYHKCSCKDAGEMLFLSRAIWNSRWSRAPWPLIGRDIFSSPDPLGSGKGSGELLSPLSKRQRELLTYYRKHLTQIHQQQNSMKWKIKIG